MTIDDAFVPRSTDGNAISESCGQAAIAFTKHYNLFTFNRKPRKNYSQKTTHKLKTRCCQRDYVHFSLVVTVFTCGYTEIDIKVLFTLDGNDKGLRGHSKKICKVRFNIDVRKYFFQIVLSIDKWNNLDQDTVDAPSLNSFKNRLNKIRSTKMGFFMD